MGDIALILVGRHCPKLLQFKLYSTAHDPNKADTQNESQSCRSRVTDIGLIAVAKGCRTLQTLNLVACGEVAALKCAKVLPYLRSLSLSENSIVTDRILATIVHACPRLHRLFLSASSQGRLTLAGILSLGHAECLNFLHIGSPCVIINTSRDAADAAIAAVVLACPRLVKLKLRIVYWRLDCCRTKRRQTRSACESGGCQVQDHENAYSRHAFVYTLPTASHERSRFRENASALFTQSHSLLLTGHAVNTSDNSPPQVTVPCQRDIYRALCDDLALSCAHLGGTFRVPRQDSPATAVTALPADEWAALWSSISSPRATFTLCTPLVLSSQI